MAFHCCLLFVHTSMWSTQRLETGELPAFETDEHASSIFDIAKEALQQKCHNPGAMVIPILVAGVTSSTSSLKAVALDLLLAIERITADNNGDEGNIAATRTLMQTVYQRQAESFMQRGHCLDVDWVQIMVAEGFKIEAWTG